MCNLNIIVKKKGVDVTDQLQNASAHSYVRNDDGDGIYISEGDILDRSENKLWYAKYRTAIKNSEVVISHQRISTSGHGKENLQPFMNDEFVLAHNGVMGGGNNEESDTCVFFKNMYNKFVELGYKDREKGLKEAIEDALVKADGGSYSIFIYDKVTKDSYYFKNDRPSIKMYELEDWGTYITTESDNSIFFPKDSRVYQVDNDKLYRIEHDAIYYVFDIKEPVKSYKTSYASCADDWEWGGTYTNVRSGNKGRHIKYDCNGNTKDDIVSAMSVKDEYNLTDADMENVRVIMDEHKMCLADAVDYYLYWTMDGYKPNKKNNYDIMDYD